MTAAKPYMQRVLVPDKGIVEVYDSDEMVSYQVNAEEGGELNRDQL